MQALFTAVYLSETARVYNQKYSFPPYHELPVVVVAAPRFSQLSHQFKVFTLEVATSQTKLSPPPAVGGSCSKLRSWNV
jgi:hypothetical protein